MRDQPFIYGREVSWETTFVQVVASRTKRSTARCKLAESTLNWRKQSKLIPAMVQSHLCPDSSILFCIDLRLGKPSIIIDSKGSTVRDLGCSLTVNGAWLQCMRLDTCPRFLCDERLTDDDNGLF